MADWLAPFHLPKFTTDEYEAAKDKHTKKYGYTISVPNLADIIHFNPFPPLTEAEKKQYISKQWDSFPPDRLAEIRAYKATQRDKYLTSLKSPSPKIVRQAGAVLTAIDDLQDAVSTLACIGLITASVVGGTTAALLTGPLGWVLGAAAIMSLINPYSRLKFGAGRPRTGKAAKRDLEKFTDKNPLSKKARLKTAARIRKFMPSSANLIEGLQTTDQIFGVGLSIGPLMGFVQDAIAGGVRAAMGEKVAVDFSALGAPAYARRAARAMRSNAVMHGQPWMSNLEDEAMSFIACNLALQAISPYLNDFNPFDNITDLAKYQVEAPACENPIVQEIILEAGQSADDAQIWPQNGRRWISYAELYSTTQSQAAANLVHFGTQNRNSNLAFIAGQNAHDFALGSMESIEGPGLIKTEYSHAERTVMIILENGWSYPENITETQIRMFEEWIEVHEFMNTQPTAKDIYRYAEVFCGFTWSQGPIE